MRRAVAAALVAAVVGCKEGPSPVQVKRAETESPEAPATEETSKPAPAPAAAGEVVVLTEADFQEKTSEGVVLVDFWAPWCPPCRMQGPY